MSKPEYPTPTATADLCMHTKRFAQGGTPLTLVVGLKEGLLHEIGGGMRDYSFPTPGTTGFCNGSGNVEKANTLAKEGVLTEEERVSFRAGNGGQLNPDWTEWLMDWPIGWTDLKPMSKEAFEDWRYRVSNCQWNEYDPAEFSKDSPAYIPRLTEDKTHRADRLKAIGNGQVPLCVYFVTEMLHEVLRVF